MNETAQKREKKLIAYIGGLAGTLERYAELYGFGSILLQYASGDLKDESDTPGYEMRQLIIGVQEMTTGRSFSMDILREMAKIAGVSEADFNNAVDPCDDEDVDFGTSKFYD